MKCRAILLAVLIASLPVAAFSAGGAGQGSWGLLFDANNLLAITNYEDGYTNTSTTGGGGAGVKYWVTAKIVPRVLFNLNLNTPKSSTTTTTDLRFGVGGEYHLKSGDVSPYLGPFLGMQIHAVTGATTQANFYFGGFFGAEVKLMNALSLFAEYELLASFDTAGTTIQIGSDKAGNNAIVGLIVYF